MAADWDERITNCIVKGSQMQLYIFTDGYPFGQGEKQFVGPETDYLSQYFEVSIVCFVSEEKKEDKANISQLPEGVNLLCFPEGTFGQYILYAIKALFNRYLYAELIDIIKSRKKIFSRIYASYKYLIVALYQQSVFRKNNIFNTLKDSVFYTYWMAPYCLGIALEKTKRAEVKLITRTHNYDLFNDRVSCGRQPFQALKARLADRVLFVSPLNREYFVNEFFYNKEDEIQEKCEICRLGCFPRVNIPRKKDNQFRIVSCSSVVSLKRVDLIAKSIIKLSDPSIEWVHFGDGSELNAVKRIVRGSKSQVRFYGYVPNEKIVEFYSRNYVDMFLTTSAAEGSPVSIQEALSFGIPIVGTNVGGVPEQIQGNGILLNSTPTIEDITNAIESIREASESSIKEMRDKSFYIWEEKYNLNNNLAKLKKLIDDVFSE